MESIYTRLGQEEAISWPHFMARRPSLPLSDFIFYFYFCETPCERERVCILFRSCQIIDPRPAFWNVYAFSWLRCAIDKSCGTETGNYEYATCRRWRFQLGAPSSQLPASSQEMEGTARWLWARSVAIARQGPMFMPRGNPKRGFRFQVNNIYALAKAWIIIELNLNNFWTA